jgi:hypothetical protein
MKRTTKIILFVAGLGALYLFTRKRAPVQVAQPQPGRQVPSGSTRYDRDIEVIRSIRDAVQNTVEQIPGWDGGGDTPDFPVDHTRYYPSQEPSVSGVGAPPQAPPASTPSHASMNGNGLNGNGARGGAIGQSRGRASRGTAGPPTKNRYSG